MQSYGRTFGKNPSACFHDEFFGGCVGDRKGGKRQITVRTACRASGALLELIVGVFVCLGRMFSEIATISSVVWPGTSLHESSSWSPGDGLRQKFPIADEDSIDILDKMLRFNPTARTPVRELLEPSAFSSHRRHEGQQRRTSCIPATL